MVVTVFVVAYGGHIHHFRHHVRCDHRAFRAFLAFLVTRERTGRRFKNRQRFARVSSCEPDDLVDGFIVYAYLVLQPMLAGDGASDERLEVRWLQRFEFDDHGTAE